MIVVSRTSRLLVIYAVSRLSMSFVIHLSLRVTHSLSYFWHTSNLFYTPYLST